MYKCICSINYISSKTKDFENFSVVVIFVKRWSASIMLKENYVLRFNLWHTDSDMNPFTLTYTNGQKYVDI